ncbi:Na+/H+ antiporter NhaA [Kocuria sp. HSID16901]|uniref:Na+/H+ antiporter NhaA n=1 Tax=Kocuria sp. HSID16901 TaxID=2419505 RepID=UPI00065FDAE6|nr:Na+/H+ antiporter NhaA [Kocuria sp. HSID16901]RUQ21755.1 Na+/H+ antiporter NhaA [Kocuria sp. HSID16901]
MSHRALTPIQRLGTALRSESMGGIILLVATVAALVVANSEASSWYFAVRDQHLGIHLGSLNLDLSVGHWASDGLLAVFFFLIGLELKKEFTVGDLRDPRTAVVPVAAAVGGVALPAIIFALVNAASGGETMGGWAIPTATDIAFAVAVLAVVGRSLPAAVRTFLLTLAVVDDLIAITIIALFYSEGLNLGLLALAVVPLALYALAARRWEKLFHSSSVAAWLILLPLGVLTWALFLGSGIHATIAGVLLGFCVPVQKGPRTPAASDHGLSEILEHRLRPLSASVCVPVFAFFSAGVTVGGFDGLTKALGSPVGIGIVVGLLLGKCLGITGATWLVTRFRGPSLDPTIAWWDLIGLSVLAGIGFTVSLLISELSFAAGSPFGDKAKVAILTGSALAAVLGGALLSVRNYRYRRVHTSHHGQSFPAEKSA